LRLSAAKVAAGFELAPGTKENEDEMNTHLRSGPVEEFPYTGIRGHKNETVYQYGVWQTWMWTKLGYWLFGD